MHIRNQWRTTLQRMSGWMLSAMMILPCMPVSPRLVASSNGAGGVPSHGKAVMAYAYDAKSPQFSEQDAKYLTHVIWSFALIKDGSVSGDHWKNLSKLQSFKRKNPRIKTLMAIGGWEADGFSQAAATAEGRAKFVSSAVALAERHGFDGIDVDWEYPGTSVAGIASSPDDKQNFTLLLADLRKALDEKSAQDGKRRLLTIAVGASAERARGIECAKIAQYVDYVNVMSYDLRGGEKTTGHHTNLFPSERNGDNASAHTALQAYENQGIPRKKLVIGAAFYGHVWKNVQSEVEDGLGQPAGDRGGTTVNYAAIKGNYLNKNGYIRYWDDEAAAPYLFNGTNFVSYEDEDSVYAKAAYARSRGLGGVMYWEHSHDPSSTLLKAIDGGLRGT